ncbi:hypothetical protein [Stutzerimonas stutzeri]|jgi:hypothetical protein|uniref:hypothetical protein n=1 Tax=Stutzerimonas stutzeri TaxID=316 RepID=UPI000F79A210|nr:hypothetical protein [Stutzerimonas stutzeri]RRV76525.1 hypothetical protein EGI92_19670 [Stutzerimonas stutzeri]
MIELFVALLLVPTSVITIWDLMMHRLAPSARKLTRLTGYIGVPVHELSHALVCVLFGMRITKMAFYQPNSATGTLGFVEYRYSPYSMKHALGMALQGIAPLLAGAVIVGLLLANRGPAELPDSGVGHIVGWLGGVVVGTALAAWAQAMTGPVGFGAVLLATIVSMHAIPSLADIKSGLRGLIVLVGFAAAVAVAIDLFWVYGPDVGKDLDSIVRVVTLQIEMGMWGALYGAVSLVTLTMLGGLALIVIPSLCLQVVQFIRGARGDI